MDRLGASAIDWWQEAGVDCIVDDCPRDWLAAVRGEMPVAAAAPAEAFVKPVAAAMPSDLTGFRSWLRTTDALPGPPAARLDPAGDPACGTMIIVDMPEPGDRIEGRLLGGPAGETFDRMLTAMKLGRDGVYLAPFSPARPATGRLDAAAIERLAGPMRHHIALVAPRRLLIFGDAAARALVGGSSAASGGVVHQIDIHGTAIPAVATIHPRLMIEVSDATRQRRQASWRDLQLFMALPI